MKPVTGIDLSPAKIAARRDADLLAIEDYIDRKGPQGPSWADEYLGLIDLYKDCPSMQKMLQSAQQLDYALQLIAANSPSVSPALIDRILSAWSCG